MTLSPQQWKETFQQFEAVLELPDAQRLNFLAKLAMRDRTVHDEVQKLLSSMSKVKSSFLISPLRRGTGGAPDGLSLRAALTSLSDFEVLETISEGSIASVYRARQISLNREVALKISTFPSEEARTMALLRHPSIVQVYSVIPHPTADGTITCMQLIAGKSLDRIFRALSSTRVSTNEPNSGRSILEMLDTWSVTPQFLAPSEKIARDHFARQRPIIVITQVCGVVCETLGYAHSRGVLHLDVKPGNILLDRAAQPYLTDFNVSIHLTSPKDFRGILGGTQGYMSPEQEAAFAQSSKGEALSDVQLPTPGPRVDARSDIFALGKVLEEWIDLLTPMETASAWTEVAAMRRIAHRCMARDPEARFTSAAELKTELDAVQEFSALRESLPKTWWLSNFVSRWPVTALILAVFLPNILGSLFQIAYNWIYIISTLTPNQMAAFRVVVGPWNIAVYSICLWIVLRQFSGFFSALRKQAREFGSEEASCSQTRNRAIAFCSLVTWLTAIGWALGFFVFLSAFLLTRDTLPIAVLAHLFISFAIATILSTTYAALGARYVAIRGVFPLHLFPSPRLGSELERQSRPLAAQIGAIRLLAGAIPLIAALTLVFALGFSAIPLDTQVQWAIGAFILTGVVGITVSIRLVDDMRETLACFLRSRPVI